VLLALRRRHGVGGPLCRIEVRDSGIGIAPDDQARVYDEFFQAGTGSRTRGGGLGLGLAIVQRLARLLELQLGLRSIPGRGSVFTVMLPVVAAPPQPSPAIGTHADDGGALHGCRIGIVEDDAEVLDALAMLLARWGCSTCAGTDAASLLAACGAQPPQLLLVDYNLGAGRTGPDEAARVFDALGRALPVLVVTGEQSAERVRELQRLDWRWLPKPVAPQTLRQALAELIADDAGGRRGARDAREATT
jgi:CheY-like chemotaxis protein